MVSNEYASKDLGLCCYLAIANEAEVKLLRISPLNNREAYFIFSNPKLCENYALNYFAGTAKVNPKNYAYKMRDFKGLLHETLDTR